MVVRQQQQQQQQQQLTRSKTRQQLNRERNGNYENNICNVKDNKCSDRSIGLKTLRPFRKVWPDQLFYVNLSMEQLAMYNITYQNFVIALELTLL